jgi:hypothetical protein
LGARPKLDENRFWHAFLDIKNQGLVALVIKGAIHRPGIEPRGFHGLLRIHAQFCDVQGGLEQRLILTVAARRGERQPGFPLLEC